MSETSSTFSVSTFDFVGVSKVSFYYNLEDSLFMELSLTKRATSVLLVLFISFKSAYSYLILSYLS